MSDANTPTTVERVSRAREQFTLLTGLRAVAVSGLRPEGAGWQVEIDVVEVARVPETASLMATYRVLTDASGDVSGYERVRRFNRGDADRRA